MRQPFNLHFKHEIDGDLFFGTLDVYGVLTPERKETPVDPAEPAEFEIISVSLEDHPKNDVSYSADVTHFLTEETIHMLEERAKEVVTERMLDNEN